MDWHDLLTVYGPLGLGWVVAGVLGRYLLSRIDVMTQALMRNAVAIDALTAELKERRWNAE